MGLTKACIAGIQGYTPDYILTNQELEQMVETTDEWITSRTGIKERHILKEESHFRYGSGGGKRPAGEN